MKLSKNYSQVATVSKAVVAQAKEQAFCVGNENYSKQECILKMGVSNDATKVMVFMYFKGQKTFITSIANLPESLLIEKEGEKYEVVAKAVLEIKEGKIIA